MKWITLVLQLALFRKNWLESQSMMQAGQAMAEKSKRVAIVMIGGFFATLFFISAVIVAVIELGNQIERGAKIYYSGLMISATIFVGIGIFLLALGILVGTRSGGSGPRAEAPPPDKLRDLAEECLAVFVSHLSGKR